jgi:4-amino-4-deoxy-L-arabinose transferase-like glycosyltransferase
MTVRDFAETVSCDKMLTIKSRSCNLRRVSWFTALCLIILAAFILRVFRLDFQSLWYDEAFSVYLAHFDLASITARTAADIQPPLYYYLLNLWIALAGDSEFAVRFLSLFFGVLTIPLLYVTARQLSNQTAALIAALLATLSPLYIWYSQEARMYTLITFLLLLSSYALLRGIEGTRGNSGEPRGTQRKWWVVFAIVNIVAVYTHYFAFVVIAFQVLFTVYALLFTSSRSRITHYASRFALSILAIISAFLPWTPFVITRFGQDASYWRGALKLDEALRHILINFVVGESVFENIGQSIAVGWLGVLVIGLLALAIRSSKSKIQNSNHPITFLLLYLIVPLALLLFLFSRNPKFNARYLMIASPAFFLLLAAGLANISRTLAPHASVGVTQYAMSNTLYFILFAFLLSTSAYADYNAYFDPAFTKASFRDVARYIEKHIAPDEAIILTSGHMFPVFNYYYHGDAPTIRLPDEPTLNAERVLGYDTASVLNQTIAGKRGAWVVLWQDEVVDPNGFVPMVLSSRGKETQLEPTNFYQVRLRHWTLQSSARFASEPDPQNKRAANFKNQVQLLGFDSPAPTSADIGASFNLYWHALDAFEDDYYVALRVVDAAGNLWGKQDRRPAGYNYPTTRWKKDENLFGAYTVPLLAGAPAGDYFVEVTFYTKGNESGLDILAPNDAPLGKSVKLGPLPVLAGMKSATFASLNIQNTISQPLPPFTLLGYQLGRDKASAGETIPLTLFWRADTRPTRDYAFRVQFGDVTSDTLPLANAQFPTSAWRAGEIVRGQYAIAIPANAKDSTIQLRIVLNDNQTVELAPFTIEKTDRVFVKPSAQFAQSANFNNYLALVGYDLPPLNLKPNETLKLTLYWQAHSKMDKPYTIFVHLLDKDGKVVAQKDAQPLNGTRPTTTWVANEYIADAYELALKPDLALGTYQIEIGWYDAKDPSFARLQVLDEVGVPIGDHIILKTTIEIR